MALSQMQPDPHGHENAGRDQRARDRLAPENDRKDGAHERRRREVGAGTRAPEIAQGEHEEHETEAIPKEAEDERRRSAAIWIGSLAETFCVRLLSMAQQAHAAAIASGPRRPPHSSRSSHVSSAPPATIATIPSATRQSTFSRKANQASDAVKTPSRLRSRDAADAGARTTGRSGRSRIRGRADRRGRQVRRQSTVPWPEACSRRTAAPQAGHTGRRDVTSARLRANPLQQRLRQSHTLGLAHGASAVAVKSSNRVCESAFVHTPTLPGAVNRESWTSISLLPLK